VFNCNAAGVRAAAAHTTPTSGKRAALSGLRLSALLLLHSSSSLLYAWPGHEWEQWREVTTWTKPGLQTDQVGRKELAPLLRIADQGSEPVRIDEIRGWKQRRARIVHAIGRVLGGPTDLKVPPPEVEVLGEEILDDHIRRHIRIRSEADDWIPAYLLLPEHLSKQDTTPARLPAMICLHQTQAGGKREPAGLGNHPDLDLALQLVRRGFVCIAPDAIGFGERIRPGGQPYDDSIAFYKRHPGWSFMGKMIWDVSRVVDYLETLEAVDPLQIGCIGHSHGAYGTLFAAAFEPRISAAIASCGFTTFRSDPSPDRWSHLTALIPQIGLYLDDVAGIPFDWHHICALIAPRPLFVWYATQDAIFPNTENLDALFRDVRTVYGLYGAADDLAWHAFDGPHRFPPEGREPAYRWLDERLFAVGDLRRLPADIGEWEQRRSLIRRVIRRTIGTPVGDFPAADVKVLATERLDRYQRSLIEYTVQKDERVRAFLCIPRGAPAPMPGVLVLHQTSPEGKREAVGLGLKPELAFAADLAERGYVTLAPDSITAGERIDEFGPFDTRGHYQQHPDLSAMGRMLHDARRALDVLAEVEGVDRGRLGAIGHSLGAEVALALAAFDERVKATVASCGYATFAAERNRLRWARDHWFSYMPRLRPVFEAGRLPHWDWDEMIRLVAPRSLYQYNTRDDPIFPEAASAHAAGEAARPIWQLYGQPDNLVNALRTGGHAISEDGKRDIYDWLDRQLKKEAR
jgi:dienelactone hydrolase